MQDTPPNAAMTPARLLAVARGFSCLFWGIGLSVMLFTGFVRLGVFNVVSLSPHVIGAIVILVGALRLARSAAPIPKWPSRTRFLLAAAVLQLYLLPFLTWWRHAPAQKLYAVNVFLLLLATLWLLSLVNRLAGDVGEALGSGILRFEARLCELSAAFFILGPAFCLLFITLLNSLEADGGMYTMQIPIHYAWPLWTHVFFAVPFMLTMATAWEAKELCMRTIEESDQSSVISDQSA